MGYYTDINGFLCMDEDSFELICEELTENFSDFDFDGEGVSVYSSGKHRDEYMNPVYRKIAFVIDQPCDLVETGEDGEKSVIAFHPATQSCPCGKWEWDYVMEFWPDTRKRLRNALIPLMGVLLLTPFVTTHLKKEYEELRSFFKNIR